MASLALLDSSLISSLPSRSFSACFKAIERGSEARASFNKVRVFSVEDSIAKEFYSWGKRVATSIEDEIGQLGLNIAFVVNFQKVS